MAKQLALTSPALYSTPVLQTDAKGNMQNTFSWAWIQNLQLAGQQLQTPVSGSPPVSSSFQGTLGNIATDGVYLYVCIGVNQWKRIALASF